MARFIAGFAAAVLWLAGSPIASAHDHWISRGKYTDENGVHCCDERDIEELSPDRVRAVPGGYLVDDLLFVPNAKTRPSEDGRWWVAWRVWGRDPRCFFFAPGGV